MIDVELVEFARALKVAAELSMSPDRAAARARCSTAPRHLAVLCLMAAQDWTIDAAERRIEADADLQTALGLDHPDRRADLFTDLRLVGSVELERISDMVGVHQLLAAQRRSESANVGETPDCESRVAVDAARPVDSASTVAGPRTAVEPPPSDTIPSDATTNPDRTFILTSARDGRRSERNSPESLGPPASTGTSGDMPRVAVPARPALAGDVQLVGVMPDSGYQTSQWLVQRGSKFIQLSELLYRIAEQADGQHTLEEVAATIAGATQRPVSANNVALLIGARLIPLGIIVDPDTPAPLAARSPLQVNLRAVVIGPRVLNPVTRALQFLCGFTIVMSVLILVAETHWWLYFQHGVTKSLTQLVAHPNLLLVLFPLVLLSTLFHEFGHATVLRHAGGRARKIGMGFYLMYPVLYTDITDSYRLRRWARVCTDLGGFYFNLIFTLIVFGVYALTRQEFLLVLILWTDLDILEQCLPIVRFDGYWAFADLIGIPDWFTLLPLYVHSIQRRVLPWKRHEPSRLPALKAWVKVAFGLYLVLAIPLLAGMLALLLIAAPAILTASLASLFHQVAAFERAWVHSDLLTAATAVLQALILALTIVGLVVSLFVLARSGLRALWRWGKKSRARGVCAAALAALALILLVVYWAAPLATELHGVYEATFPTSNVPLSTPRMPAAAHAPSSAGVSTLAGYYDDPTRVQRGACSARVIDGPTSASATHVVPGVPITFSTTLTALCVSTGLIDFELYNPDGAKVWQDWLDNQALTGQPQTFTAHWIPPADLPMARYRVAIGVFTPGWGTNYDWQSGALLLDSVAGGAVCSASPTIFLADQTIGNPAPARGNVVRLGAKVHASCDVPALVTFNVYSSGGARVWNMSFGVLTVGAEWRAFTAFWTIPPALASGTYRVELHVLDASGIRLLAVYQIGRLAVGQENT